MRCRRSYDPLQGELRSAAGELRCAAGGFAIRCRGSYDALQKLRCAAGEKLYAARGSKGDALRALKPGLLITAETYGSCQASGSLCAHSLIPIKNENFIVL